jgi:AcrR family transcriptional regulator
MPRSAEQFGKIREQRRRQILDVALQLFARDGFERTSVAQIARTAGISKGLMYNYFESKEAMLSAILLRSTQEIASHFDPDHDGILSKEELHYLIDGIISTIRNNTDFYRLLTNLMLQPHLVEHSMPQLSQIGAPLIKLLQDHFAREGHNDPEAQAYLFGAALNGIIMNYIKNPDNFPLERVSAALHQLFN